MVDLFPCGQQFPWSLVYFMSETESGSGECHYIFDLQQTQSCFGVCTMTRPWRHATWPCDLPCKVKGLQAGALLIYKP